MVADVIALSLHALDDDATMPPDTLQRFNDLREDLADIRLSMRTIAASQGGVEVNQARIETKVDAIEASIVAVSGVLPRHDELAQRVLLQGQRLDGLTGRVDAIDGKRWDVTKLAIQILGAGTVGAALIEGVKRLMGGGR